MPAELSTGAGHRHRFRVALHDTDAAGVLFYAHLFRHAHDAYEGLMAAVGYPIDALIRDGRLALPIVHAQADYRRPLRHGDGVIITAAPTEIGARRFTIDYRFTTDDTNLMASARTVHAALDTETARPTPLPDALAMALGGSGISLGGAGQCAG